MVVFFDETHSKGYGGNGHPIIERRLGGQEKFLKREYCRLLDAALSLISSSTDNPSRLLRSQTRCSQKNNCFDALHHRLAFYRGTLKLSPDFLSHIPQYDDSSTDYFDVDVLVILPESTPAKTPTTCICREKHRFFSAYCKAAASHFSRLQTKAADIGKCRVWDKQFATHRTR